MSKLDEIRSLRERQFTEPEPAKLIAVYRCFDETGELLYLGQSANPMGRIADEHGRRFVGRLATVLITWHNSRAEALAAEREAISAEKPAYNLSPGASLSGLPRFKTVDGKFDRRAYQREYMRGYARKRRAAEKAAKP